MANQALKEEVARYWNKASCGTEYTDKSKYSAEYFNDIENLRYRIEPEIFSFAQFTRFRNKKVLEVGVGAGTDFTQWLRAGALAYGIDLTQEAIDNVTNRLDLENLKPQDLQVADAEQIPYQDNFFDLVYSWGVIHHSPNTVRCLEEIIRVTKPNGTIKLMIYNRHSLFAFYRYICTVLSKGNPFQSFKSVLYNHQESIGTKAYTLKEIRMLLKKYPVEIKHMKASVTNHDLLYYKSHLYQRAAYTIASLLGWNHVGWFMTIELNKKSNA